jgi:phytoene desaturase
MRRGSTDRIGVVGGGLGGLAAACTLAARGYDVTLFERRSALGGKAAVLEERGFRFDMGPTILTVPSVLRRIFAEAGERLEERLPLARLDPQWRSFFEDGSTLDLDQDVGAMAARLDRLAPGRGVGEGYRRFIALAARQHDVAARRVFYRSVGGLRDVLEARGLLRPDLWRDILAMRPGRTVAGTVRAHIPDARAAQMIDHFVQYVGSAPDQSPAVLCGIAHMQASEGVWYPRGGIGAVPAALRALASELGVAVRSGDGVRRILQDGDGGVSGVETDRGERVPLRALVSNADAVRTHRELLSGPAARRFERRRRYEPACSGVVLYLGLDRGYDHLLHHGFVFSRDPREEFDAIYRRGEPAPDPTCYVCAPARTDPSVAPPGGEALYVLVHAPCLRAHHDWARMLPAYRRTILDKLARAGGMPDLERRIVVERSLTPRDIHERYGVLDGAIYGIASHGRLSGAFKPANRSPDVRRLYLAGGAAHPGPGVPMVLMSGWIAADALDRDGVAERARDAARRAPSPSPALAGAAP